MKLLHRSCVLQGVRDPFSSLTIWRNRIKWNILVLVMFSIFFFILSSDICLQTISFPCKNGIESFPKLQNWSSSLIYWSMPWSSFLASAVCHHQLPTEGRGFCTSKYTSNQLIYQRYALVLAYLVYHRHNHFQKYKTCKEGTELRVKMTWAVLASMRIDPV